MRVDNLPPSLSVISRNRYLEMLESVCSGYINLVRINSLILRNLDILGGLRKELNDNLCGVSSSSIRQDLIDTILHSNKFPSPKYQNQYNKSKENDSSSSSSSLLEDSNSPTSSFLSGGGMLDTLTDRILEDTKLHGSRCCSLCCTGAFLIETMLSVVIHSDIREIKFTKRASDHYWNYRKLLKRYVPFHVPVVLHHYAKSLVKSPSSPSLTKLAIYDTDIPSTSFAIKNNYLDVLKTYEETWHYLSVPAVLMDKDPEFEIVRSGDYGPFTEHLMAMLTQTLYTQTFYKLTEIILGREACNTSLRSRVFTCRELGCELMMAIGSQCPNLKILDLSRVITLSAECLLFLFYKDAYSTLHRFAYLPQYETQRFGREKIIVQNTYCEPYQISHHHNEQFKFYCPWCRDQLAPERNNKVRPELNNLDILMPVIDDRLYNAILSNFPYKYKNYLMNVLKASHLIQSARLETKILKRPNDLVTPSRDDDWPVPEISETEYVDDPDFDPFNPIIKSLKALKLNLSTLTPKHEIVPFLLEILPDIKSLGHVNILRGLEMIQNIPALKGITAKSLEEIEYTFGGTHRNNLNTVWADDEIYDFIEDFALTELQRLEEELTADEKRSRLNSELKLIAENAPNLIVIHMFIYGDVPFIRPHDEWIWEPLTALSKIRNLNLHIHQWNEVSALIKTLGNRLKHLYLALDGLGGLGDLSTPNNASVPKIDDVIEKTPHIESLTLSFGIKSLKCSDNPIQTNLILNYSHLTHFCVHTYINIDCFLYVWKMAVNLVELKIGHIDNDGLEGAAAAAFNNNNNNNGQDGFFLDECHVIKMFKSNPMLSLRSLKGNFRMKSINAAQCFIEHLGDDVKVLEFLLIRIGLRSDDYQNQDDMLHGLAYIMQKMRNFKIYCNEKIREGLNVNWKWDRYGYMQTLTDIDQLNALVEP